MHIHVDWSGPYTYEEATKLRNEQTDFGVYQIYGAHAVYGSDVLLYIGKAEQQTFGLRLSQESWNFHNQDASRVLVYVGRLGGYGDTPSASEWSDQISLVEKLLIYSHWPAGNSSGLHASFSEELYPVHILNWGCYRDLLPEMSGSRYSDQYHSSENYRKYGET